MDTDLIIEDQLVLRRDFERLWNNNLIFYAIPN